MPLDKKTNKSSIGNIIKKQKDQPHDVNGHVNIEADVNANRKKTDDKNKKA